MVAVPLLARLLFKVWPRTPLGRRFLLTKPREDATLAATPAHMELDKLRGRIGKTLAPLRPAGVADFDGRRVDVITEGMMVDGGQWVRCIDVRAGKVDRPAGREAQPRRPGRSDFRLNRAPGEPWERKGRSFRSPSGRLRSRRARARFPTVQRRITMSPILFAQATPASDAGTIGI